MMDEEISHKISDTSGSIRTNPAEEPTDELQEVRDVAKQDTWNVRVWRFAVTGALMATAICVTMTTFLLLQKEQRINFETAFQQFSRTVGDAAIGQQKDILVSYRSFADNLASYAISTNQTWPYFRLPQFESFAGHYLELSHTETMSVYPLVLNEDLPEYIGFVNRSYEEVVDESHMIQRGNTDMLNRVGYHPFPTAPSPQGFVPDKERPYYFPSWHFSPAALSYGFINWNPMSVPDFASAIDALLQLKNEMVFGPVRKYIGIGTAISYEDHVLLHSDLKDSTVEHPHTILFLPIHKHPGDDSSPIVAIMTAGMAWDRSLLDLLPKKVKGIIAVITNTCGQAYTYNIDGGDAIFMGNGDLHDPTYDEYEVDVALSLHTNPQFETTPGHCLYMMRIFPSKEFRQDYNTRTPEIFAIVVGTTFVIVTMVFFIYDMFVQRRNEKLVESAAQSNALVSQLFPPTIRDRIIANNGNGKNAENRISNLKSFLNGSMGTGEGEQVDSPLADLFLATSIVFADIAGFTAWSSVREPSQVFTLLETVFSSFDRIAKARKVFKVETVGDCYVAATGIPDPRPDHAVVMVRFAKDVMSAMHRITKELEITHGPDTGDLSLRIGINSGPVTAGVLRGDRCRFQLFGDTMNVASRMESTGEAGRIQVSADTAECLKSCGKVKWMMPRKNGTVQVKGKGDIQTYWISTTYDKAITDISSANTSVTSEVECDAAMDRTPPNKLSRHSKRAQATGLEERCLRLVDWNVEMLVPIIRQIVAQRKIMSVRIANSRKSAGNTSSVLANSSNAFHDDDQAIGDLSFHQPLSEVREIIRLPGFDNKAIRKRQSPEKTNLDGVVIEQLRDLLTSIASMYRGNDFHNFEHASHVTMSVIKLLARIVAPTDLDMDVDGCQSGDVGTAETLHDHTYGITSDPLTQFACAFSALIHDVDHTGVPNAQLVKEKTRIASMYGNRSVAEQNSLVLAWELFMMNEYTALRNCICATPKELGRLRQLVVNAVMATDIVDKELKSLRNDRWEKAFSGDVQNEENGRDAKDRKATIVIEHLIQASDVAHTMQHWHVYRKWNERFFRECYAAYICGRADNNPADTWYKGEIGFFDFYIIPLAKKLKECGVFGKSSDEYLNYAIANRQEWERRGQEVVEGMMAEVRKEEQSNLKRRPSSQTVKTDESL